jgi:hypothetical protein
MIVYYEDDTELRASEAIDTSLENPDGSLIAISASIFRFISILASFRPLMN